FSPDGEHLASIANDSAVRIWDWAKAKEVRQFAVGEPMDLDAKAFGWRSLTGAITYAPDGKAIATRLGYEVKLWNPATGDEIPAIRSGSIQGMSTPVFSPDGKTLAIATVKAIVLVEPATGREIRR